jgi:hypothetical protein
MNRGVAMSQETPELTNRRLRTPRAAAVAGILFSVLFSTSMILIWLSIPASPEDQGAWLESQAHVVAFALRLFPFAGIAFLWFLGVVRDRMGEFEDRFFSTVFFGSGLLFLAMSFIAAALAGGILFAYAVEQTSPVQSSGFIYSRAVMYQISNVYGIRMAGVFMMSLGTIWIRTQIMPRPLVFLTYGLALVLLVGIGLSLWITLVFPGWVFVISVYILILNYRRKMGHQQDGLTVEVKPAT